MPPTVYPGKIAIKIPVIKSNGSSTLKKIYLGTLESPQFRLDKITSFICKDLQSLYEDVLNDEFDCRIGIRLKTSVKKVME